MAGGRRCEALQAGRAAHHTVLSACALRRGFQSLQLWLTHAHLHTLCRCACRSTRSTWLASWRRSRPRPPQGRRHLQPRQPRQRLMQPQAAARRRQQRRQALRSSRRRQARNNMTFLFERHWFATHTLQCRAGSPAGVAQQSGLPCCCQQVVRSTWALLPSTAAGCGGRCADHLVLFQCGTLAAVLAVLHARPAGSTGVVMGPVAAGLRARRGGGGPLLAFAQHADWCLAATMRLDRIHSKRLHILCSSNCLPSRSRASHECEPPTSHHGGLQRSDFRVPGGLQLQAAGNCRSDAGAGSGARRRRRRPPPPRRRPAAAAAAAAAASGAGAGPAGRGGSHHRGGHLRNGDGHGCFGAA